MRPATCQVLQSVLCETCATQIQIFGSLHKLMLPAVMQAGPPATLACPGCHCTWQQLNQASHLGCPDCYRCFRQPIEGALARLHGQTTHQGRRPQRAKGGEEVAPPSENLGRAWIKDQLDRAVAEERYEDAARLRDQLRALES